MDMSIIHVLSAGMEICTVLILEGVIFKVISLHFEKSSVKMQNVIISLLVKLL